MRNDDGFEGILGLEVEGKISDHDQMFDGNKEHYFAVGLSAAWAIDLAVRARRCFSRDARIENILDYGCGCGRVGRYLRAMFPDSSLFAHDLRADDVAWYESMYNASAIALPIAENHFDLIWLGSVFTHLGAKETEELLSNLFKSLRRNGVIIFSTHGRCVYERLKNLDWNSQERQPSLSYELDAQRVAVMLKGYETDGFGYVDYHNAVGYGIAIGKPAFYEQLATANPDVTQVMTLERGYDDHQDVFAFMKRPISSEYSSSFLTEVRARPPFPVEGEPR